MLKQKNAKAKMLKQIAKPIMLKNKKKKWYLLSHLLFLIAKGLKGIKGKRSIVVQLNKKKVNAKK